jgi:PAS domain S-box-containing protein
LAATGPDGLSAGVRSSTASRSTEVDAPAVLDALGLGVAVVGPDGTIRYANPALADLFDTTIGELVGAPVEVLVPAGERAAHVRQRARFVRSGEARAMDAAGRDVVGVRSDGRHVAVDVQLAPMAGGDTLAVVRDARRDRERVAAQALAQAELAAAHAVAERSVHALDAVVQRVFGVMTSLEAYPPPTPDAAAQLERCLSTLRDVLAIAADGIARRAAPPRDGDPSTSAG